ncbi:TIGR02302 family protein [Chachezhania sediminis]|uniref:TIGR02302 family protein n=1 Tax=Chachezhania sediminis TaxID=2599291 RepID=UPI00131A8ACC|nr:TIGR02302 family protein [Chachezhania sediminis]
MADRPGSDSRLRPLRLALGLTHAGLIAERLLRAFWPLLSLLMLLAALPMLGVQDMLPLEAVWSLGVLFLVGLAATLGWGIWKLRWPSRADALARLDATMPGRPIQAMLDAQATGADDAESRALWQAHQRRMEARAAGARPVEPDLKLNRQDPYGLRYMALLALSIALIFGSIWRVESVARLTPGSAVVAGGPSWEGWVEPPRYTGLPTLYLADIGGPTLNVPEGSRITLRLYGQVGDLTVAETVSGRTGEVPSAADAQQSFDVAQNGRLTIKGPGGRSWNVVVDDDTPPDINATGPAEVQPTGAMKLPFTASDDHGVASARATIALDMEALDRRYGLAADPDPREPIAVDLPMPLTGGRAEFDEALIEDFSQHPWANMPVTVTLEAVDDLGQVGSSAPFETRLVGRRFFDPMAAAVIEMRRDLLWSMSNAENVAMILRAVSYRPEDVFRSETAYLRLRMILRRLETFARHGLTEPQREELAVALWDLAVLLEDGDLGDALERMRRAQERLSEAMRNGASDQEIAELMQDLREATEDYLQQLSRQAQQQGQQGDQQQLSENAMTMTQDDLQRMMDRIQELMEQGRMAEAQEALRELQQMMENMRVTQGQGGQGSQSPGQQAMEGLAETLRDQQGLSDQAFRDLQEQFNPNARAGEQQGNQGRDGNQGRGQQHGQQGQSGQPGGNRQGEGGQNEGAGNGAPDARSLAERQRALRDELDRQRGTLPGAGTSEGQAARDALDQAGRAMEGAEDALENDDLAGAIDRQAEAMEALREGMRQLGEALAQEQQQGQPGQGQEDGNRQARNRDPLGRPNGSGSQLSTDDGLLQGEDVYRRARELLDEIRRRSGDGERPEVERDYLKRLLERF